VEHAVTPADREEARRLIEKLTAQRDELRKLSAAATVIDFEAGFAVARGIEQIKSAIGWLESKLRHG
jgi:myo-inositol catabolism protein IolC